MLVDDLSPCFKYIKDTLGDDLIGVEIGIWTGGNALAVLTNLKPKLYYMIDPFREYAGSRIRQDEYDRVFLTMFSEFNKFPETIIMRKTSEEASKEVINNLDFVYIDGDHSYEMKVLDLNLWYPKVRSGGILCGDDYNLPVVKKAVCEFTRDHNIPFEISKNCDPHPPEFWMIKP